MITYRTLRENDFSQLYETMLAAFSDYAIKIKPTSEEFRRSYLTQGVLFDHSVGAFDGEKMIGFTSNAVGDWQGTLTAYDAGTGVVPDYRRRGISRAMFGFLLPILRRRRIKQYLLEVITKNEAAVGLYKNLGFSRQRTFEVFKRDEILPEIPRARNARPAVEAISAETPDWKLFQSFWTCEPSWQNSRAAIGRARLDENIAKTVLILVASGETVGYGIFSKSSGSISQFAVAEKHRRRGFGNFLLRELQKQTDKPLMAANIDRRAEEVAGLLRANGFALLTSQYEMLLKL